MRLGYFGGSFDPPHLGHLAVARAAAANFSLDQVLFVPTGRQPLKPHGAVAPFTDRLAMVDILCREASNLPANLACRFTASSLEAPGLGDSPNYTVDSVAHLRQRLAPSDDLFVLTGADAFLNIRCWRDSDRLLSLAQWIVVSRPGISLDDLAALDLTPAQLQRIHPLQGIHEPASATTIRNLLSSGADCSGLLSPGVLAYILRGGMGGVML